MLFHPAVVEADSDFYTKAPIVLVGRAEFDVPAETLWQPVEDFGWIPFISSTWETPAPHGRNSRRRLGLGPLLLSNEFVTHLDPGREIAFFIGEIPLPGVRAMAERLVVEPLGPQRSSLTYTVAIAPKFFPRVRITPVSRVANPFFSRLIELGWGYALRRRGFESTPRLEAVPDVRPISRTN
ncbi:hypothetical protein HLB23_13980 [Nocardia uniformis]|uniref:SRPBCC family protein n=1 Tax=Nocardia uniformis TaxID=53432 RepID=A0A849C568_9NOCA|nr:hypothetical protein [Nocardia uniformis]NNH70957.1 hypothetical protein [Nocardia uniformis]